MSPGDGQRLGILRNDVPLIGLGLRGWLFDVGYERPADFVERIPGLSMRERSLIPRENAARLLKL